MRQAWINLLALAGVLIVIGVRLLYLRMTDNIQLTPSALEAHTTGLHEGVDATTVAQSPTDTESRGGNTNQ